MAKLIYKICKIKNSRNSDMDGKIYARSVATETLSFQDFINHVISHGSVYDRGTVQGIMYQMVDCMKVWLGDLGIFYLSIVNRAADDEASFNITDNVVGVRVKFRANQGKTAGLDSKSIRKEASFIDVKTLGEAKKKKSDDATGADDNTGDDNTQNP